MKDIIFKGCGTAIATPFANDEIDYLEFKKLLKFQIKNKADSIIVCGTTGESATMTTKEKAELIKLSVKTCKGKIPVIAGTGSNNTSKAVEMSKIAESLGVDGLLIVTPYYNKTTQKGLIKHYKEIASSVNIPIILYNVPSRTGVNIEPKTCLELSKIKNIVAIKEASGNISQVAEIASLCGYNLNIYSGNDDQIVPTLSLGGIGVISVLSNVLPEYTHNIVQYYLDGDQETSKKMQLEAIPLIKALFSEVNPIPIKYALNLKGFNFGKPRLPLVELSPKNKKILEGELKNFNI